MPPGDIDIGTLIPGDLVANLPGTPQVFTKRVLSYAMDRTPRSIGGLSLYCEDGYQLALVFISEPLPDPMPPDQMTAKIAVVYLGDSKYLSYVDLVRNADPVYVTFDRERLRFRVATGQQQKAT